MALRLFRDVDDLAGRARALWLFAYAGSEVNPAPQGGELLDEALEGFRSAGDRWGVGATLVLRAKYAHIRADPGQLRQDAEEAARVFGELGERWGQLQAGEWLGGLAELTGDYDRADRLQREGLRIAEELRLWPDVAMRLAWLEWTAIARGAWREAREYGERALRMAVEQRHQIATHFAEIGLGFTAMREGRLGAAEAHLSPLLKEVSREAGPRPPVYLPLVQVGLGLVAERRGDRDAALGFHSDALAGAIQLDAHRSIVYSLEGLAAGLSLTGRPEQAARMLGAAAAIRRARRLPPGPVEQDDVDRVTARVCIQLSEDAFDTEMRRGGALSAVECLSSVAAVNNSQAAPGTVS
jgi:tetratricopeptide (TPR) repeat protein